MTLVGSKSSAETGLDGLRQDPWFWVHALQETYLPDAAALFAPDDTRRLWRPSSYEFNPTLAGRVFDQESLKRGVWMLREMEVWRDDGRLVLATNGEIEQIAPQEE